MWFHQDAAHFHSINNVLGTLRIHYDIPVVIKGYSNRFDEKLAWAPYTNLANRPSTSFMGLKNKSPQRSTKKLKDLETSITSVEGGVSIRNSNGLYRTSKVDSVSKYTLKC